MKQRGDAFGAATFNIMTLYLTTIGKITPSMKTRVTRMGNFSPIRLLFVGSLKK
jgi:hypothetical protein